MATAKTTTAAAMVEQSSAPEVSIVTPAYNEADNLTPLVQEIASVMGDTDWWPYEIIIVDDGSTDDTSHVLEHLTELFPQTRALELARNFGQSHALQAGIDAAKGGFIVTIDADLQNDPADIPMLLAKLQDSDVECVSGRRRDRQDPLSKRIPSRIQTVLAKRTGANIHDFGCTLKAYDASALDDITIYGEGHRYIPAKLHAAGYRVAEQEVNHRERENGSSHYGAGRLVRGFVDLVWHWFQSRYGARPMHIFGGIGLLCMLLAGGVGAWSVVDKLIFGTPLMPHLPRLIAVVGLGLFGLVLFVFGVLAEMLTRLQYEHKQPYRVRRRYE